MVRERAAGIPGSHLRGHSLGTMYLAALEKGLQKGLSTCREEAEDSASSSQAVGLESRHQGVNRGL